MKGQVLLQRVQVCGTLTLHGSTNLRFGPHGLCSSPCHPARSGPAFGLCPRMASFHPEDTVQTQRPQGPMARPLPTSPSVLPATLTATLASLLFWKIPGLLLPPGFALAVPSAYISLLPVLQKADSFVSSFQLHYSLQRVLS